MRPETEQPVVRLSDYTPPAHLVDEVSLTFRLDPDATRVLCRMHMRPNPVAAPGAPLSLDGRNLRLISARIDGADIPAQALRQNNEGLNVAASALPEGAFIWEAETEIAPRANTALEGLYTSNGMYCTQCEAQGFRKITYFPDRPDVLARYRVRIEGEAPVMLSNGNLTGSGPGWAEWEDPHPKPCYLFALVAGDLRAVEGSFTTASGREVLLQVWVRPGDEPRCTYALGALQRAMRWDEDVYGREYDLDRFMIVAVDDFNMGAMENKGLNIFNSKCVLASPETATDADYHTIEAIIAHEYFHNWTGNRITCRDWFQLCLKEGLTVFRDQQFSADMHGAAVRRIEDVGRLRSQQFPEDAGALAHPVRPERYVEINNFYTATVYEKGAELIGMLRRLVGPDAYRAALDLYFTRHDGQACTIEDWLAVFEDATGRDLTRFKRWYSQAGTPRLRVREDWTDGRYTLHFSQHTPPTPDQPEKTPVVIPVAYGLIGSDGTELAAGQIVVEEAEHSESWDLPERPVPSLLRGFSAPVILERQAGAAERLLRLAHDRDPFARWEAAQEQAFETLTSGAPPEAGYLDILARLAADGELDAHLRALLLTPPGTGDLIRQVARSGGVPDPMALFEARRSFERALAARMEESARDLYDALAVTGPYAPDAKGAGRRALRARLLALMTVADPAGGVAQAQFESAGNMTERMTALTQLVAADRAEAALARFSESWGHDRLVMDKWFSVQAAASPPHSAADRVEALTGHPTFDWRNPNRFRALLGAFAGGNPAGFHREDGAGYRLLTDWLLTLDPVNPQTAARLTTTFGNWRIFDTKRKELIRKQLERLQDCADLSKDTREMVTRLLRSAS